MEQTPVVSRAPSNEDVHKPSENATSLPIMNVVVRLRPPSPRERADGFEKLVVQAVERENEIVIFNTSEKNEENKTYQFDRTFGPDASQRDVFVNSVEPLVQQVLRGRQCTVLAYGQTNSGKTHSIMGDMEHPEQAGLLFRSCSALLMYLREFPDSHVHMSCLEVYNETVTDLLADPVESTGNSQRMLGGNYANGAGLEKRLMAGKKLDLEQLLVDTPSDAVKFISRAMRRRVSSTTLLNESSSRSHAIFILNVSRRDGDYLHYGKLTFVDLAGSENYTKSGAVNRRETKDINQSLLALGRVIEELASISCTAVQNENRAGNTHNNLGSIPTHIYRQSVLTQLLRDSLNCSGNTHTLMLVTIPPTMECLSQTKKSLDYGGKARKIRGMRTGGNASHCNSSAPSCGVCGSTSSSQLPSPMTTVKSVQTGVHEYIKEIQRLKNDLHMHRTKENSVYLTKAQYDELQAKSLELEDQLEKNTQLKSLVDLKCDEVKQVQEESNEYLARIRALEAEKVEWKQAMDVQQEERKSQLKELAGNLQEFQKSMNSTHSKLQVDQLPKFHSLICNLVSIQNNVQSREDHLGQNIQGIQQTMHECMTQLEDRVLKTLEETQQRVLEAQVEAQNSIVQVQALKFSQDLEHGSKKLVEKLVADHVKALQRDLNMSVTQVLRGEKAESSKQERRSTRRTLASSKPTGDEFSLHEEIRSHREIEEKCMSAYVESIRDSGEGTDLQAQLASNVQGFSELHSDMSKVLDTQELATALEDIASRVSQGDKCTF